jgi:hypothetical protein
VGAALVAGGCVRCVGPGWENSFWASCWGWGEGVGVALTKLFVRCVPGGPKVERASSTAVWVCRGAQRGGGREPVAVLCGSWGLSCCKFTGRGF